MKEKVMLMIKRREQINEVEKLKENMMENNFIWKLPKVINKAINHKDVDTIVDLYSKYYCSI